MNNTYWSRVAEGVCTICGITATQRLRDCRKCRIKKSVNRGKQNSYQRKSAKKKKERSECGRDYTHCKCADCKSKRRYTRVSKLTGLSPSDFFKPLNE